MDKIIAVIFSIQGLVWFAIFVVLLILIIKRIKNKKDEDFEKRDN